MLFAWSDSGCEAQCKLMRRACTGVSWAITLARHRSKPDTQGGFARLATAKTTTQASPSGMAARSWAAVALPVHVALCVFQCSAWWARPQYHTFWQRPHFDAAFSAHTAQTCSTTAPTEGKLLSNWAFKQKRRNADQYSSKRPILLCPAPSISCNSLARPPAAECKLSLPSKGTNSSCKPCNTKSGPSKTRILSKALRPRKSASKDCKISKLAFSSSRFQQAKAASRSGARPRRSPTAEVATAESKTMPRKRFGNIVATWTATCAPSDRPDTINPLA
mmetsp:Transcript_73925/g.226096  ORF Transcript_73925/g.226096 Transcript_73925/m.226096 type:complete len:277 (-) Transcript_73925:139-969(-)